MTDSMSRPTHCPDDSFGPWAGPTCRGGFDFTLYFEEAILSIPVDAIFLVAAVWIARRHFRQDVKLEHSKLNRIRTLFKLVCLFIITSPAELRAPLYSTLSSLLPKLSNLPGLSVLTI